MCVCSLHSVAQVCSARSIVSCHTVQLPFSAVIRMGLCDACDARSLNTCFACLCMFSLHVHMCMCVQDDVLNRALDIGCAVGRASFELARSFDEVVGIDFSHAFVARCNEMKYAGLSNYVMPDEGELGLNKVARVAPDIVS